MRSLTLLTIALTAAPAIAAPSLAIVTDNTGGVVVQITTDAPGALAAEIAFETFGVPIEEAIVNTDLFDDPNPGDNPYLDGSPVGGDTTGLWIDHEAGRVFASFGSEDLGVGTFDFLSLDLDMGGICGDVSADVGVSGLVAQTGVVGEMLTAYGVAYEYCPIFNADFDFDGAVGDADLTLLLSNWGEPIPPVPSGWIGAQPTAPNVGDDELTVLLSTWGFRIVLAVPEPTGVITLLACLALGMPLRRKL
ncbi:hypothetical protein MalM25_02270 [Planctomycetes bacterium MalM25]|nr:hypothetical protein MalM25_02270 [Planctomycetes bacterium MalM25]